MTLLLVVDWSNRSKRTARKILQTRILVSWRFISAHKADCAPLATAWKQWRRDWRYYAAARDLDSKPIAMQVGTFFNCAGPAAQEVSSHFSWTEEGEQNGLTNLLEHFDNYCNPRCNVVRERYEFYSRAQQSGESITSFLAALRLLVSTCEFPDKDGMLRDRLCMGVRDRSIQRALLKVSDLTLQAAIEIALSEEASRRDQQSMGHGDGTEAVSAVSQRVSVQREHETPDVQRSKNWLGGYWLPTNFREPLLATWAF